MDFNYVAFYLFLFVFYFIYVRWRNKCNINFKYPIFNFEVLLQQLLQIAIFIISILLKIKIFSFYQLLDPIDHSI